MSLIHQTATEIVNLLKTNKVSVVELLDALQARISEVSKNALRTHLLIQCYIGVDSNAICDLRGLGIGTSYIYNNTSSGFIFSNILPLHR